MANTEEKVLGWDDEIQNDGEYSGEESVILPEGNYDFEVIKTEKSFYQPGPKSSLPSVTATTLSRPMRLRFKWASALSS